MAVGLVEVGRRGEVEEGGRMEEIGRWLTDLVGQPGSLLLIGLVVTVAVGVMRTLLPSVAAQKALVVGIATALGCGLGLLVIGVTVNGALAGLVCGLAAIGEFEVVKQWILKPVANAAAKLPNLPNGLVLLVFLPVVFLGMGCATAERHAFTLTAVEVGLTAQAQILVASDEWIAGVDGKAVQDRKRVDDALMLKMEQIAMEAKTGKLADPVSIQAAIVEAMLKYQASRDAVDTDRENARERDTLVRGLVADTVEALQGLLEVEREQWVHTLDQQDLTRRTILAELERRLGSRAAP